MGLMKVNAKWNKVKELTISAREETESKKDQGRHGSRETL